MSEQFQFPEVGFSKSFRGYQVDEVESYVDELRREFGRLVNKLSEFDKEISRMRELESSLLRAMQMAEEAQKSWQMKVEAEAKAVHEKAVQDAKGLVEDAKKQAEKITFLAESERKNLLAAANQELKEQERGLISLQEAQKEIANQLAQIAQSTLTRIQTWNTSAPIAEPTPRSISKPAETKTKAITKTKAAPKAKALTKAKSAKPSKSATNPLKPNSKLKPAGQVKTPRGVKKTVSKEMDIQDDGLPTLNKVLEAYAKSTGPRGKIGDIN
jgi:DivIVA domain-containing protein